MKVVIFLGAPGTGKGTIAKKLIEKNEKIHQLSTGDIFRKCISVKNELGNEIEKIYSNGNLISDEITNKVFKFGFENLILEKNPQTIILDGYPRSINQEIFLEELLSSKNLNIYKIYYFIASDEILVNRIIGRLVCPKCGKIYNEVYFPPKQKMKCDIDNETLLKRLDDNPEKVKVRLQEYLKITKPLIEYYESKKKLIIIDANQNNLIRNISLDFSDLI